MLSNNTIYAIRRGYIYIGGGGLFLIVARIVAKKTTNWYKSIPTHTKSKKLNYYYI